MTNRTLLATASRCLLLATGTLSLAVVASPAAAGGVRAGTTITNTASATFDSGGGQTTTVTSNTVSFKVDEVLDVTVVSRDAEDATVSPGSTGQVRSFTVTNIGNGPEAFVLAGKGAVARNNFDPAITTLAIDTNGDGTYEVGVDQLLASGGTGPVLEPDAAITVFVISDIPADAGDGKRGRARLDATAVTGSGAPGTVFAGRGTGGGDAVVGATRATAFATGGFVIARAGTVSFVKSATVADPYGGTRATPGATITYRLIATVSGSGGVIGLRVTDTAPDGTTYLANSLMLDGAALTDAADGDAGSADTGAIAVALGTQPNGAVRTVTFKVKIN